MADGDPVTVRVRCALTAGMTDADVARETALLDEEAVERLGRLVVPEDRRDHAAAHALLRRALTAIAPDVEPAQWRFVRAESGRPSVPAELTGGRPISFSLSHTRGLVACAVSAGAAVGVDAEVAPRRGNLDRVARQACSTDERAQLLALAPADRARRFLDLWTLKEAYLKARGVGITVPLQHVSFDLREAGAISPTLADDDAQPWSFALLTPSPDSRVAVAAAAPAVVLDAPLAPVRELRVRSASGRRSPAPGASPRSGRA
jgi:4'-phosphopantetheinyl transferase